MIPLYISQQPGLGFSCSTDEQHSALALWLEFDMAWSGGGGAAEELFEDIGAFGAGKIDHAESWGNLVRLRVDGKGVLIQPMVPSMKGSCVLSLDEFTDVTLRWFDSVNPEVAVALREILATWLPV